MSCRFSTCLEQWLGKEVGYSWNSPTCTWHWIWPKWRKNFHVPQSRKRNISLWNNAPRSEKRWCGVLSFLGTNRWRLRYKESRQCFFKAKRPAAFRARMAPQRIRRHVGEAMEDVHLYPTDAQSGLQCGLHSFPACHTPQTVTLLEFELLKSSIWLPDIRIQIQLFRVRNFSMITIPSTILISIQIFWLMKVTTLSVVR